MGTNDLSRCANCGREIKLVSQMPTKKSMWAAKGYKEPYNEHKEHYWVICEKTWQEMGQHVPMDPFILLVEEFA